MAKNNALTFRELRDRILIQKKIDDANRVPAEGRMFRVSEAEWDMISREFNLTVDCGKQHICGYEIAIEYPRERPDFCRKCGAEVPMKYGEGTCNACDPEYVFVGGPLDGERLRVSQRLYPDRPLTFPVPVEVRKCALGFPYKGAPIRLELHSAEYRAVYMWDSDKHFIFMRHGSLTDAEALRLLIQGYKKCSNSKDNRTAGHAR